MNRLNMKNKLNKYLKREDNKTEKTILGSIIGAFGVIVILNEFLQIRRGKINIIEAEEQAAAAEEQAAAEAAAAEEQAAAEAAAAAEAEKNAAFPWNEMYQCLKEVKNLIYNNRTNYQILQEKISEFAVYGFPIEFTSLLNEFSAAYTRYDSCSKGFGSESDKFCSSDELEGVIARINEFLKKDQSFKESDTFAIE